MNEPDPEKGIGDVQGTPTVACPRCGEPICDEILADTPECPHGWESLEGMTLADIKATFADLDSELSIDPVIGGGEQ